MTELKPETLIHRLADLELNLVADNSVRVFMEGGWIESGKHTFEILKAFATPTPLQVGLRSIAAEGSEDYLVATATVKRLHELGCLLTHKARPFSTDRAFGNARVHISMLNDRARVDAYFAGLRAVVRPGDVVLDIGTGTGVLALAAAQAGARRVYAIESGSMADVAQANFDASAYADRITLIRGWSTQVELPELADVVVSEIIGNDPLGEGVIPVILDARKRLLKPGARYLPGRLRVLGLPVSIPGAELAKHLVSAGTLETWREWYGTDFSPLKRLCHPDDRPLFYISPQQARDWLELADPVVLAEIDFATFDDKSSSQSLDITSRATGMLNGLLVGFELTLGPATLNTLPGSVSDANHWESPVFYLSTTREVRRDERLVLSVDRTRNGWLLEYY